MSERLKTGGMRKIAIQNGLATEEDIEGMIKSWEEWQGREEASLGMMNGEIIIRVV